MSGDDISKKGMVSTLKGWLSGGASDQDTEAPDGAEVIPFDAPPDNQEDAQLFHVDANWRVVQGAWVAGQNACSTQPEEVRSQTMGAISRMRTTVQTVGDKQFLAKLYEKVGERSLGLPDFPETPMRLDHLMTEEEPNSQQVMRCIESDPKLVGRVWARARSARFPTAPGSLDMAVSRIGLVEVWRLSLEAALDILDFRAGVFRDMAEEVRVHGALVAEVTSGLVGQRRGPSFLAGLLHDVGQLVLLQAASQGSPEVVTVQRMLDAHHADFSVLVTDAWHLDATIIPAVAHHHDPNAVNARPRDLSRLLCIADIAVDGEIDRRAHRNSQFISTIARYTRSRVLASKALNQAAMAIDRLEAESK
jgi:HD-like signal output (HDOD) protein